jgi:hypothetical protein
MPMWLCRAGRDGEFENQFLEDSKQFQRLAGALFFLISEDVHSLGAHFFCDAPGQSETCHEAGEGYVVPQFDFQVL